MRTATFSQLNPVPSRSDRIAQHTLKLHAILIYTFLYLPILVVVMNASPNQRVENPCHT